MTHRTCARFLYSGGFGVCTRVWCLFFITIGTNRDIRDISGYYEQRSSDNFTNMKNAGVLRYLVFEFCERRGRLCSSKLSFLVRKAMNCLYFIRKSDRSFHSVLSNCYWFLIKKKCIVWIKLCHSFLQCPIARLFCSEHSPIFQILLVYSVIQAIVLYRSRRRCCLRILKSLISLVRLKPVFIETPFDSRYKSQKQISGQSRQQAKS